MIIATRERAAEQRHTAQELALLRHALADELAALSGELVSSLGGPEHSPTLLEDVEALHRSLKELESVKGYVQVVERAMQLRCVAGVFPGHARTELPSGWYGVVVRLLLSRRARRAW